MKEFEIDIDPVPKPRMTRADRWKKRSCVMRYREYADNMRQVVGNSLCQNGRITLRCIFQIKIPKSSSKKKQKELLGKPHTKRPDIDNLAKGVMDAILEEDSGVYKLHAEKYWGEKGKVIIQYEECNNPA